MKRLLVLAVSLIWCASAAAQTDLNPSSGQSIVSPKISGTVTGTYTLGGTPTITGLASVNGWTPRLAISYGSDGATPAAAGGAVGAVYDPGNTITLTGGTFSTAGKIAVVSTKAVAGSVVAGGTGGTNGACTVTGTTGTGTKAQYSGTVTGNALTGALTVAVAGDYSVNPTTPTAEPVTGCGLTGATVNMGLGVNSYIVQNPGVYTAVPSNPVAQGSSTGSGTGATFTLTFDPIAATAQFGGLADPTAVYQNTRWGRGSAPNLTTGNELTAYGYNSCNGVTTGGENTCIGWSAGGAMNTSFNVYVGGAGVALSGAGTGFGNTVVGDVALRNITDAQGVTLVGNNSAKLGSVNKAWGWTGVGASTFINLDNGNSSNDSTAFGINACQGAVGTASFRQVACIGGDTGGALTNGNHITILGTGVGNATVSSGTNIVLIGTDGNTDSNTSSSVHIGAGAADVFSVTGTNSPSTSLTTIAGLATITGAATLSNSLNFATLADSATAPTIASGGCTTGSAQSIATNGTAAFDITLGGATCGSTITLTLPAATTKWHCTVDDVTTPATNDVHQTAAGSTTSVVLTNFVRTTGVAGNFTAADHLVGSCRAL